MQFYAAAAILALAGSAVASPQALTLTTSTTTVVTITSCAPEVTLCPARTSTVTNIAVNTYPVNNGVAFPSGAAYASGTGGLNFGATGTGVGAYHSPTPSSGYNGPSYTGAAGQVKVAGALAGVGAVAALLL